MKYISTVTPPAALVHTIEISNQEVRVLVAAMAKMTGNDYGAAGLNANAFSEPQHSLYRSLQALQQSRP